MSIVNINLSVVNRDGVAQGGVSALLLNPDFNSKFNPNPTQIIRSGNTDGGGRVLFTGISAGTYDIRVSTANGNNFLRNYIVKNVLPVNPGTSSLFEGKNFIQSEVSGTNILAQSHVNPTGVVVNTHAENSEYQEPFTGDIFTKTTLFGKNSGNSFRHDTAGTLFTQRAQLKVV